MAPLLASAAARLKAVGESIGVKTEATCLMPDGPPPQAIGASGAAKAPAQ
jgi:hypothetical protein